jgi:cysteine desulfurase/selenocysteine lyase
MLVSGMREIPYVHIIGNEDPCRHSGIVTFTIDGVHPHDIASILDTERVAIRAGHHCAQPLMQKLNVGSTARASLYFYNTKEEVDALVAGIHRVSRMF